MGRDQGNSRFALPAPPAYGGKEILALRRERRSPSPLRRRITAVPHRSRADRGHELVKRVGRILQRISAYARFLPRTRERQGRAQSSGAGGRQGGNRAWHSGETVEIGGGDYRCLGPGGRPCTGPVNPSVLSRQRSRRPSLIS